MSNPAPAGSPDPANAVPDPLGSVTADPKLVRLREYTATALAAFVMLATGVLLVVAVVRASDPDGFAQVKDLLLFVNPLVGYVIGYYFNRVTSEPRAENAESMAQSAARVAEREGQERTAAEERGRQSTAALAELASAATPMTGRPKTLGGEGGDPNAARRLESALSHAHAVLGWQGSRPG
ncbi:hypothetical protein AB0M02_35635 [Actinoplanes sp. NPDC051861]|uniref:hypothetical protein n=1 Tax=Actinoplanes sp. NPDC051861 TaxID=3155170 RepID=UPI00344AA1BC